MAREIKFRAWLDNKMIKNFSVLNGGVMIEENPKEDGLEVVVDGVNYYNNWATYKYKENAILMQYTGLKDKNGVEIYEGDKIILLDENDEETENVGFVEWNNTFGFWNVSNIEDGLGDLFYNNTVVVIGNIHENKELLGDSKC